MGHLKTMLSIHCWRMSGKSEQELSKPSHFVGVCYGMIVVIK